MPEVLLKAVSISANIGKAPKSLTTINFDIKPLDSNATENEDKSGYYNRDHKSVVNRIPNAFSGKGYYIEGNFKQTIPAFYKAVIEILENRQ